MLLRFLLGSVGLLGGLQVSKLLTVLFEDPALLVGSWTKGWDAFGGFSPASRVTGLGQLLNAGWTLGGPTQPDLRRADRGVDVDVEDDNDEEDDDGEDDGVDVDVEVMAANLLDTKTDWNGWDFMELWWLEWLLSGLWFRWSGGLGTANPSLLLLLLLLLMLLWQQFVLLLFTLLL